MNDKTALQAVEGVRRWYLGAQNDGLFIIDTPPRPSNDDQWHDRPDGPSLVIPLGAMSREKAQAIVDAHNAAGGEANAAWLQGYEKGQQVPGEVKVTDEMVTRALAQWPKTGTPYVARDAMRAALTAALKAGE